MAAGDIIEYLRGTITSLFSIGKGSTKVQIKNSSGVAEMRNFDDSAYVITRGLDPVAAQDYVTKTYGDTTYGGSSINTIQFSVALVTASSTALIPAGAQVVHAEIEVGTAYDGTTPTISLGDGTTVDLIQATTMNDPEEIATYITAQNTDWPLGTAITATVAGAGISVGASIVTVWYVEPLA